MEQKQKSFSPPTMGGVSLLVVFAVLCLTVFALLSLSTVQADSRLGEASAKAAADYYAADVKAHEVLARLRAGEWPDGVNLELGDNDVYTYVCPISETQDLVVEVEVVDTDYRILRWQAVPVGDWAVDEGLELWDGVMF